MLKNKYFAISLLIFALIIFYFSFVKGFLLRKASSLPQKPKVMIEEKRETGFKENINLNEPFKKEEISQAFPEEWGRDIFRKKFPEEEREEIRFLEPPKLSGIFRRDDKRFFAILNGKIVKEGDRLDGILVKRILENSVIIDRGAGEEHVYIFNLQKGGQFEKNK
jgi:hypothetical protein